MIFGICVALCVGLLWACAEVVVLIPSHLPGTRPLGGDPGKLPITLQKLKEIQKQKNGQMQRQRGLALTSNSGGSKTLEVPYEPQHTPAWCWAATSRMIMNYQNRRIDPSDELDVQCKIVMNSLGHKLGGANCCERLVSPDLIDPPPICVRGEWPSVVFERYGFNYESVEEALDWESLTNEINGNRPFLYVVDLQGGGKHALVVKGYDPMSTEGRIVQTYDPNQADFEYQTLEEFMFGKTHYRDYALISPKAEDES
jgi:hypothetical protein